MALHIFAAWKSITQGHRCDDCDDWSGGASTEAFVSAKRLKEHAARHVTRTGGSGARPTPPAYPAPRPFPLQARCPFTMVPCTNAKAGCTALVRRFQLNVHRLWECKHEAAACVHCGVKMPRLQLKSHLWPPLAVPCRYDCGHHFKSEKAEVRWGRVPHTRTAPHATHLPLLLPPQRKHAASCWVLRSLRAAHEARELGRRSLLAGEARRKVEAVMEENDVFFNGAREERTQQSALGIAQSYSVHHLVPAMRGARLSTI